VDLTAADGQVDPPQDLVLAGAHMKVSDL